MKQETPFNFFIPLEYNEYLEKSATSEDSSKYDNMIVEGKASDNSTDFDGQNLEPNGFILDLFLQKGLINYEHMAKKGGAKFNIGHPVEAYIKNNEFFIKAKLWKGNEYAQDLWDTMLIMKANNVDRQVGWSIEGASIEKDPSNKNRITKSLITNCALTFMPKNFNSYADIVKGVQEKDYINYELSEKVIPSLTIKREGKIFVIDNRLTKAITAGAETGAQLYNTETSGASLKQESISDEKDTKKKKKKRLIKLVAELPINNLTDEAKKIIKSFLLKK